MQFQLIGAIEMMTAEDYGMIVLFSLSCDRMIDFVWFTSTLLESGMPIRILVPLFRLYVVLPKESCRTPWSCKLVLPNVWWDHSLNCQNLISGCLKGPQFGLYSRTEFLRALAHVTRPYQWSNKVSMHTKRNTQWKITGGKNGVPVDKA